MRYSSVLALSSLLVLVAVPLIHAADDVILKPSGGSGEPVGMVWIQGVSAATRR